MNSTAEIFGLLYLPQAVLLLIIKEYLLLDDISKVDISLCTKSLRGVWLSLLQSNEFCYQHSYLNETSESLLAWLIGRRFSVRTLSNISDTTANGMLLAAYLSSNCGANVDHLFLTDKNNTCQSFISACRSSSSCIAGLISVVLENSEISDDELVQLFESCSGLMRLNVNNCRNITDRGLSRVASKLGLIEHLSIINCGESLTDSSLGNLQHCLSIKSLEFGGESCAFTAQGIQSLFSEASFKTLVSLKVYLFEAEDLTVGATEAIVGCCPYLEEQPGQPRS